jgi:hypothetical protein
MTATITRSIGISPGVPWGGPLPGGGFDGKTKRLDRAVARFAEWLQGHFACNVQVRFNSHRLSGGAFVYPGADKIEMDTPEIGLGARLTMPAAMQEKRDRLIQRRAWREADLLQEQWERNLSEDTPLDYTVLVYPQFLRDPNNMGEYKPGNTFGYWTVTTPQEAYRLLRKLVKEGTIR